jgi:hypothetical protein
MRPYTVRMRSIILLFGLDLKCGEYRLHASLNARDWRRELTEWIDGVALWRWSLRRLPLHRRPHWCCSVLLRRGNSVVAVEKKEKRV